MNHNFFSVNNFPIKADRKSYSLFKNWIDVSLTENLNKYYVNGHSKFLNKVSIKIVQDIDKCKYLWNKFSKRERLYDLWEFRYAFHKAYNFKPYFIVLKSGNEIVGILPLDYNIKKDVYWWFGGDWQEDNSFFTTNDIYTPLLLFFAPKKLELFAIRNLPRSLNAYQRNIVNCDSQYKLDLIQKFTLGNYLDGLKKKKRYNLKRDIDRILKLNPKIVINNKSDYKQMNTILMKRFHSKGELPDFESDPEISDAFANVIKNNAPYKIRYFSIYIDGRCVATDIVAIYKGVYYALKGAYDVGDYSGIGNYIFVKEIEDAIKLGMKEINFLQTDYGWKHKWFQEVPLYQYKTV